MPWKPGQSGNPAGRPRGKRDAITQAFLNDLEDAWRRHGPRALDEAAETDPVAFCKLTASLVPRDIKLTTDVGENFLELLSHLNGKQRRLEPVTIEGELTAPDRGSGNEVALARSQPSVADHDGLLGSDTGSNTNS